MADEEILNRALAEAVRAGDAAADRRLLSRGADPNSRDDLGETVLMRAASESDGYIVQLLLEAAADRNVMNESHVERGVGATALLKAIHGGRESNASVLLSGGADPNQPDTRGQTPLMAAVACAPHLVETLLMFGADVNAGDGEGRTALGWAEEAHAELVRLLRDAAKGVRPTAPECRA
jgi:ankyrin repeat protein